MRDRAPTVLTLLLGVLMLSGCAALHTGSLRVEVETYKGPLSKQPMQQWGELTGLLKSIQEEFKDYNLVLGRLASQIQDEPCTEECRAAIAIYDQLMMQADSAAVQSNDLVQAATALDAVRFPASCRPSPGVERPCADAATQLNPFLKRVAAYSAWLKSIAIIDIYFVNSSNPRRDDPRLIAVAFVNMASESSNQIGSRADALAKQLDGDDGRYLAQSVLLRDSGTTAFVNAYTLNSAMRVPPIAIDSQGNSVYPPSEYFSDEERTRRVRALEQYYADHYWSNINTVVATGQGEASMALIKDDIGNWNLKNFANDPSEMLQAYKNIGLAALKEAAKLAADQTHISDAQKLKNFADQFATGASSGGNQGNLEPLLVALHTDTSGHMQALIDEASAQAHAAAKTIASKTTEAQNNKQWTDKEAQITGECTGRGANVEPTKATAAEVRVRAGNLIKGLTGDATTHAEDARKLAKAAQTSADSAIAAAPGTLHCDDLGKAVASIERAETWRDVRQSEAVLDSLPQQTRSRIADLLSQHERNVAGLVHADAVANEQQRKTSDALKVELPKKSAPIK
jgi:hypothetical protein